MNKLLKKHYHFHFDSKKKHHLFWNCNVKEYHDHYGRARCRYFEGCRGARTCFFGFCYGDSLCPDQFHFLVDSKNNFKPSECLTDSDCKGSRRCEDFKCTG